MGATSATGYRIAERLERLPMAPWHNRIRGIIAMAWFFDAFDALAIAYVLPAIVPLWHLGPAQIGGLISTGYAGQAVGSLLFGWLAQRYGRVPAACWALMLFSLGSLACAFAFDYQSLFWIRFIQGIGLGGEIPVVATYLSEYAPTERRARFIITSQIAFPIGLLAASGAGLLIVPNIGWQWLFVVGAVPAVVAVPLFRMLPESVRWLTSRGREAQADRVLTGIEQTIAALRAGSLPPIPTALPPALPAETRISELLRGRYAKRSIALWSLWIATYLVNYSLIGWLPTIWGSVFHLSVHTALVYGFITSIFGLFATCLVAFTLDFTGRKIWFGLSLVLAAIPLIVLRDAVGMPAWVVLVWVCIALGPINTVSVSLGTFTSENYPTHLRALGSGVASCWQRLASMVGPILVGLILPSYGLGAVFIMFAAVSLAGGVLCFLLATETKGRTLEQLSPSVNVDEEPGGAAPWTPAKDSRP
jgi:MFS transporter, putative metabolite:H+ symporter